MIVLIRFLIILIICIGSWLQYGVAIDVSAKPKYKFSRIIIYDIRGMNRNESTLIIEQKENFVKIWYKNYLGQRQGAMPLDEYIKCFDEMINIKKFALRKKHRGRLLRRNAAKGSITLAWESLNKEKEIRTIQYYAPENTLDDFRIAFNKIWSLSRYAILSIHSIESPVIAYREDAIYFMTGTGWMTKKEIQDVIDFQNKQGTGERMARKIWAIMNQSFAKQSEFNDRQFLRYCVKKSMLAIGQPAINYLESRKNIKKKEQLDLASEIMNEYSEKKE